MIPISQEVIVEAPIMCGYAYLLKRDVGGIKNDLKLKIIIKNQLGNIDSEYEFSNEDEALEAFRYIVSNEWFG
ncbi:hypothetical protein N9Z33_03505 [Akkermansiaceae bacterium]|nr:hypothetical protein [Akkermansiaceae bacterium]MDB4378099.1 hypothetical protein [Akkermansiaceae bacterium]